MASNNPAEYINPIIQAMIAAAQGKQQENERKLQEKGLAERTRAAKAEEQNRADSLKALLAEQERAQERFNQEHDLAVQQFNLNKQVHGVEVQRTLNDLIGKGYTPQDLKSQPLPIPGMGTITIPLPEGMYRNPITGERFGAHGPSQLAQDAANAHGLAIKAEEEAKQPYEIAGEERKGAQRLREITAQGQNTEKVARINAEQRAQTGEDSNDRMVKLAMLRMMSASQGVNPDIVDSYARDLYIKGTRKESSIPQNIRPLVVAAAKANGYSTPLDPKDSQQIEGIPVMQDFFEKAEQLANMSGGLMNKGKIMLGMGEPGRVSQELNGLMGNIAKIFGGERGVMTEKDITRAKDLVNSLSQGQSGNLKKVQDLKKVFSDKLIPILSKYGDNQASEILQDRKINFSNNNSNPAAASTRKVYNPNTGNFE